MTLRRGALCMSYSGLVPVLAPSWALPTHDNGRSAGSCVDAEELSGLGRLAFAFLWLFAFAMPWEDAVSIPGFGTGVRLIGIPAVALGVVAIIERGRVRRPGAGHVILI